MAITVNKWIGSNGDVLIPLNQNESNSAKLYSVSTGALFIAQITETIEGEGGIGSPMGLLLSLTYAE